MCVTLQSAAQIAAIRTLLLHLEGKAPFCPIFWLFIVSKTYLHFWPFPAFTSISGHRSLLLLQSCTFGAAQNLTLCWPWSHLVGLVLFLSPAVLLLNPILSYSFDSDLLIRNVFDLNIFFIYLEYLYEYNVVNGGWRFMAESQKSAIKIWRMA